MVSLGFRAKGLVTHYDVELLQPFSLDFGIHAINFMEHRFLQQMNYVTLIL